MDWDINDYNEDTMKFGRERVIGYNGNKLIIEARLMNKNVSGPRIPIKGINVHDLEILLSDFVVDILSHFEKLRERSDFNKIVLIDKPNLTVVYDIENKKHEVVIKREEGVVLTMPKKEGSAE